MEKAKIEMEVPKEAHELFSGMVKIVAAAKEAMADGWDLGTDMPVVITKALVELAPMIQGIDKLDDEFLEDPSAFIKAAVVSAGDIASLFVKKEKRF